MTKEFVARRLDVKAFAQDQASLGGDEPLARLPRLLAETQDPRGDQAVSWKAAGELRNPGHVQPEVWLHLRADAVLALTCQRCLGAVNMPVAVDRDFRFLADEAAAAAEDEDAEEDVLVLSRSFNLMELLEDELLMAVPLAPRHEVCPEQVPMQAQDEDFDTGPAQPSPFAVLGKLKKG